LVAAECARLRRRIRHFRIQILKQKIASLLISTPLSIAVFGLFRIAMRGIHCQTYAIGPLPTLLLKSRLSVARVRCRLQKHGGGNPLTRPS
jgi:hypothetical protein